jgi:hypothetical protein
LIETSTLVSLEQAGKLIETKFYKNNVIWIRYDIWMVY